MIKIRSYENLNSENLNLENSDSAITWAIKFNTIRNVNIRDYTLAQIKAWAPDNLDMKLWQERVSDINPFIAELNGQVVGFADLQKDGYIDHFFCHSEFQRIGIGRALMEHIFSVAHANKLSRLYSKVSLTARAFYEHHGFKVVKQQYFEVQGEKLTNFIMEKTMKVLPELETENLIITILTPEHAELLVQYESVNRSHLLQWEPLRPAGYFSLEETKKRIESNFKGFQSGASIPFVAFDKNKTEIIGLCTFSNIVLGVLQACHLGYSVSENKQGKGLMFEMLQAAIDYVFSEYNLHRIMANYIPTNSRSENLLNKLGFQKEGLAKSYLKISGAWQDHVLTSKINPNDTEL